MIPVEGKIYERMTLDISRLCSLAVNESGHDESDTGRCRLGRLHHAEAGSST